MKKKNLKIQEYELSYKSTAAVLPLRLCKECNRRKAMYKAGVSNLIQMPQYRQLCVSVLMRETHRGQIRSIR